MIKILDYATNQGDDGKGYNVFEVEPAEIYQAMGDHALQLIQNETPMGDIPERERRYYSALNQNQKGLAFVVSAKPRSEFKNSEDISARANALETLRHWFTYLLKEAHGGPIGVRIFKNDDYKL